MVFLSVVVVVIAALYFQAFRQTRRLRRERAALDRPAKFIPSAHERHALAQARYQANMTLPNYHALRAAEDALEHSSTELHREGAY